MDSNLSIISITPSSTAPQPYSEPLGFHFKVSCLVPMEKNFRIVFYFMNLADPSKDIELEDFEIDKLPDGISEFDLDVELMDHNEIPIDELCASHGLEIVFVDAETNAKFGRRACEIVIAYKDPQEMEENLPDEILAEHLVVKNLGARGAPKFLNNKTAVAPVVSGQIRQREEGGGEKENAGAATTTGPSEPEMGRA
jgi:hypothetical protein